MTFRHSLASKDPSDPAFFSGLPMPGERVLTLLPYGHEPEEVEVSHWFVERGRRYAVVSRDHHGEPLFYVREERHITTHVPISAHERCTGDQQIHNDGI